MIESVTTRPKNDSVKLRIHKPVPAGHAEAWNRASITINNKSHRTQNKRQSLSSAGHNWAFRPGLDRVQWTGPPRAEPYRILELRHNEKQCLRVRSEKTIVARMRSAEENRSHSTVTMTMNRNVSAIKKKKLKNNGSIIEIYMVCFLKVHHVLCSPSNKNLFMWKQLLPKQQCHSFLILFPERKDPQKKKKKIRKYIFLLF